MAAEHAELALAKENQRRHGWACADRLRLGAACRDVLYGNIGSDTRLDFTVIGQRQLTARIESMCRQLGVRCCCRPIRARRVFRPFPSAAFRSRA